MPKLTCQCGAKYRFADSAIGKKAKCKKCGTILRIEPEDEGPIPLADAPDMLGEIATAADRAKALHQTGNRVDAAAQAAAARALPETGPSIRSEHVAAIQPTVGTQEYFRDLLATFVFITKPASLLSFAVMWVILVVGIFGSYVPIAGFVLLLMSLGWYAAFRFSVVASAAAGEKEVVMLSFEDGIVVPLLKWIGTWALAFVPVIVFVVVYAGVATTAMASGVSGIISASGASRLMLLLTALGLFLWPMIVLCVCLGGFEALVRIDLVVPTLIKTFPVYILTVGIVMGTVYIDYAWGVPSQRPGGLLVFGPSLTYKILGAGITLYADIIAMRAIGLYYFHFKRRFAWDWG